MSLITVTPFLNTAPGVHLTVTPKNGATPPEVIPATVVWAATIGASKVAIIAATDTLSCDVHPVAGQSGGVTITASVGAVSDTFQLTIQSGQVASLNGAFQLL